MALVAGLLLLAARGAETVLSPTGRYLRDRFLSHPSEVQHKKRLGRDGIVGRGAGRLRDDDPIAKAQKLVRVLSQSIVKELRDSGERAEYLPGRSGLPKDFLPADATLPNQGWLVDGWFVEVTEGRRVVQAEVGFGAGAGQVEIQVVVSDLARGASEPFLFLGSTTDPKIRPGGLVLRNPYVMAAKFVLTKGATDQDVKKQGSSIARQLLQHIDPGVAGRN